MKIIIITLLVLGFAKPVFAQKTTSRKLDDLITAYVNWNKFNGSVLVAQHGKILLEKGYGFKNVQDKTLNDKYTIFQIGSLTKEFTATIILKLAEQRKLAITDRLSTYYPDFPKGDSITINNLLTHTSGIFNYTEMDDFWNKLALPTNEQNVLEFLKSKPLAFSPGKKYSYSNSNYMLLAYIIQKVTHQSYEMIVRDWIFRPLHMSLSGFDYASLVNINKAKGYTNFTAAETTEGPLSDSTQFIGSGEIYSTVGDLYKWHQASQKNQIISESSWEQAYQAQKGPYGYGWEPDTMYKKKIVGHRGRMFGFTAKMIRVPADDVFVILLNNNSDDPYLETIGKKILAIVYGYPDTLPPQPVKLSVEKLKEYTGTFVIGQDHSMEVKLINGHLFGGESGKYLEWIPIKDNYFRFMKEEVVEGDIEFGTDTNGKVTELHIIRKDGAIFTAKKAN